MTQLAGRSGRRQPGDVIIQTYRPDAPEILLAAKHDAETFLEQELQLRRHAKYPPVTDLVRLLTRGPGAAKRAETLKQKHSRAPLPLLAATAGPTLFGGGSEWQVLLRGDQARAVLDHLDLTDVFLDIDPLECL